MRCVVVLVLLVLGAPSGNAATLVQRLRLAQNRTFSECIASCNSSNFSCAQNCGLSGSCVAQCTAAAAACKTACSGLK